MSNWNKTYHWKTKECTPWARKYFEDGLVGESSKGDDGSEVKVDRLEDFEGDVELGQRKGKLITIYDTKLTLDWSGTTKDGETGAGKIEYPEVSHEVDDAGDEHKFEVTQSSGPSALADLVRTQLAPSLAPTFRSFRPTLIETHGKDFGGLESPSTSGAATPSGASTPSAKAAYKPAPPGGHVAAPVTAKETVSVSSAPVKVREQFATSAEDLFSILTDPGKIPMWSRAPAQFSLNPGSEFSLFAGGVTGFVDAVERPSKLVQRWRAATWPKGHHGTMTITLEQGSDATTATFSLSGVPVGMEDTTEAGLEGYYVRGLKSIGLGTML